MSEELEELNLEEIDVDPETGEVTVKRVEDGPIDAPKTVKGSATLIKNFIQCPAKAYGSMTRQPQTKGISLVQGIAIHTALERYIKYEEDPEQTFHRNLIDEAERNQMLLTGKEGDEARRVGAICVASGKAILDSKGNTGIEFRKRIKPEYVERGFVLHRNGRKYVGKIDFVAFSKTGYIPADWKSGRTAPSDLAVGKKVPKEADLKTDVQFTLYAEGPKSDPTMTETYGKLPERLVYLHLRGKSNEYHESGRRKAVKDSATPPQYDFPTTRTQEEIDSHFSSTIEPVMTAMEQGIYYRNEDHKFGCSWCGFYDRERQRCKVELPADSKERIKNAREAQASNADHTNNIDLTDPILFGENTSKVIEESRRAGLKPYSG